METLEAIHTRKSIRKFLNKEVPLDIVRKILEAGIRAPSGCNCQPWRFIVTTDSEKTKTFTPDRHYPWVEKCPAMIVVCINPHDTWAVQNEEATDHILDTAAAIQNILLAIHDLGLGAVWITGFSRTAVRKALDIPEHWLINSVIPFGYYMVDDIAEYKGSAIKNSSVRPRKPLSDVAFIENISNPM